MNPELPRNPREEMELRITALLLGELPEGEAAALREALTKDPELAKLHDDLKATIQLVRSAATKEVESVDVEAAQPKLSEARRKKLLTAFVIPSLNVEHRKPKPMFRLGLVELAAVLAILVTLAAMFLPALQISKSRSQLVRSGLEPELLSRRSWASEPATPAPPQAIPPQSPGNVYSINAVGYTQVDPTDLRIVDNGVQVSGQLSKLTDAGGKDVTTVGRSESDFADYLTDAQRKLAAIASENRLDTTGTKPAKSISPIVLPALSEAERGSVTAGAASQTMPSQDYDSLTAYRAFDQVRDAKREVAVANPPAEDQKPWTISGELRGFYDDQQNGRSVGNPANQELERLSKGGLDYADQTHTVARSLTEPYSVGVLERAPEIASAGDVVAQNRFYRLSGGGGAGGGGLGGAVAQGGAATSDTEGRVPVLGDVPMLGKAFRESETLKRDGAVLADNFAASDFAAVPDSGVANPQVWYDASHTKTSVTGDKVDPATGLPSLKLQEELQLGRAIAPGGTVEADPETRRVVVAGIEAAQDKSRADLLGVNAGQFGTFVPQAQSLEFRETGSTQPAQQPAPSYGFVLSPVPTTPAVAEAEGALTERYGIAAGEVKKGVADQPADPARQLNESLAGSLRIERGRALVREGKELAAVEPKVEAAARFKTVTEANLGNQVTEERLALANGAKSRDAVRSRESASKDTLVKIERELTPTPPSSVSVPVPQAEPRSGVTAAGATPEQQITQSSRAYYDKKRELESLRTSERILGTKLAAERIDQTIPRTSMVEIVDKAQPAKEKTGGLRGLGVPIGGSYASTARVAIDREVTDIEGVKDSRSAIAYDPYFVQTQFEVMQSEPVLDKVVESLDLTTTWAKNGQKLSAPEAVALLKQKLDLKPVKNSSLVEIRARDEDPDEAAKIANAVAEVYTEHRMQERSRLSMGGITALVERYQEQLEKITKAQAEVEALRQRLNISDTDAGGTAPDAPVKVEIDTPLPRKSATNAPIPQPEIQTSENNFSTFSLNVSDVSFKLAAASLEKGQMPDAATVRSEEFINAFDYRDPEPAAGAPVAFTWERARYPFAHNRDLLRFSLKTAAAGRQAGRPLNVVLLLDNSGSMERADRVHIIREALAVLATQLQPQDKLSVITFARTPRLVADGVSGDKAGELAEQVSDLTPQGGTNLEDAMNLAYATAARHYLASGINRVVLLTDGAANLGNVEPESLKQKVEAQRKQGIALDAFGIGWEGFNDDLLEVLSRNGDGRYGFINSPEEAATEFASQLAGALKVAASDVKVQVEFNPKRATAYRQIGYAKHQLTKEQFRDNTVDAAEIAAQEAGNALYTVEVNPAGEGPLATVRVRYKIPGTTDYREQAWDVPFAGNAAPLEHSSAAMRLAASASAFAEWLVASPFAGEVTPDRLLGYLGGVPEVFGADSRPKKLEWMIRQAKSVAGN